MIVTDFRVRSARPADQFPLANLMYTASHVHRHLDWRSPLDWLGSPAFWVLEQDGRIQAALACPLDPPGVAWVRLFTCSDELDIAATWQALWATARSDLDRLGAHLAAVIGLQSWFGPVLLESRFRREQTIILLEHMLKGNPPASPAAGATVREMRPEDLPEVAEVDQAAFAPLWQNGLSALQMAYPQAAVATVVVGSDGLLGYQITTRNTFNAHLARLAVRPAAQGHGLGLALLSDLLGRLRQMDVKRLTVNTQGDNLVSQALYRRAGFQRTGEQYPVYQAQLAPSAEAA